MCHDVVVKIFYGKIIYRRINEAQISFTSIVFGFALRNKSHVKDEAEKWYAIPSKPTLSTGLWAGQKPRLPITLHFRLRLQ